MSFDISGVMSMVHANKIIIWPDTSLHYSFITRPYVLLNNLINALKSISKSVLYNRRLYTIH